MGALTPLYAGTDPRAADLNGEVRSRRYETLRILTNSL